MSVINPDITNDKVIPVVESNLFDQHQNARFAVGVLAVNNVAVPGLDAEYKGYFDLRRKVYYEQTGQLDESDIQEDGTDRDADDDRSVAFGIVENRATDSRVVAATRLIIKGSGVKEDSMRQLPVEEFCPDLFADKPVQEGGIEVSRLIARYEKASVQEVLRWRIYAAALGYIANHDLGPTYGVIEPWLQRHLQATIPITAIGEPRFIEHYLDYNLPIQVHTDKFIEQMKQTHPGVIEEMRDNEGAMSYFGKLVRPKQTASNVIPFPQVSSDQSERSLAAELPG